MVTLLDFSLWGSSLTMKLIFLQEDENLLLQILAKYHKCFILRSWKTYFIKTYTFLEHMYSVFCNPISWCWQLYSQLKLGVICSKITDRQPSLPLHKGGCKRQVICFWHLKQVKILLHQRFMESNFPYCLHFPYSVCSAAIIIFSELSEIYSSHSLRR